MRLQGAALLALSIPFVATAEEPSSGTTPKESDPIAMMLREFGLERRDIRPDPLALLSSRDAANQHPILRVCLADPLRAGWRIGMLERTFASRTDSVHRLVMFSGRLAGADVARGFLDNPLAAIDDQLVAALDPLAWSVQLIGGNPTAVPSMEDWPLRFRAEVARLLATSVQANSFLDRAFRKLPAEVTPGAIAAQILARRMGGENFDYRLLLDDIEMEALVAGLLDLTAAVEDFNEYVASNPAFPDHDWTLETPAGLIRVMTSRQDHVWSGPIPLLSIDLYGNDLMTFLADAPAARASIVYDREGNDVYTGPVARGIMGYGILWDRGGNDRYEGDAVTQAAAILGGALLVDEDGNDVYTARTFAQAAAVAGVAMLLDRGGNDEFRSLTLSQASGGPRGAGVLMNLAGNDQYLMAGGPIVRSSPQLPDRNSTQGQGCGWGVRADLTDGRSLAGGIGLLMDLDGDDRYEGDVFCQGAGFQEGLGALVDHRGNDVYTGAWYAMGAAAHRAVGILIDRGGDDVYTASHYTSIAAAHDGSTAVLLDEAGDDNYSVRNLGLGGAHDGGFAVFVDGGGNDSYKLLDSASHGLGSARITHYGTAREEAPAMGLFLDAGGADAYSVRRPGPANDALWRWAGDYPELALPAERGVGLDGEWTNPMRTEPRTAPSGEDERNLRGAERARRAWRDRLRAEVPD